jgi:hypothetical protein
VKEPNTPSQPIERRSAQRTWLQVPITFRARGRSALPVTMTSVSRTGCSVIGGAMTFADTQAWVKLPGLESTSSRVIWTDGNQCGLSFEQALHPAVADRFAASALVQPAPTPGAHSNVVELPSSRREQIKLGYAETYNPLLRQKKPSRPGPDCDVSKLIARQVKRHTNHRQEERYPDPHASEPMSLRVAGRSGEVIEVSASGLRARVDLSPAVGRRVPVTFGNFPSMKGRVVWMKDGVVGIDLPPGSIELSSRVES